MRYNLFKKLAWDNIKRNSNIYLPYIVSAAVMLSLFYNIVLLANYDSFSTVLGGQTLKQVLILGVFITGIFVMFFLYYTSNYIFRLRKKSIGLYTVLGMNKKNIITIIIIETLFIYLLVTLSGFFIGIGFSKILTAILFKLMNLNVLSVNVLSFDAIFILVIFVLFNMSITILKQSFVLKISRPLKLLNSAKQSDKPTKSNLLVAILGIIALGIGYFMAITITNPIKALSLFFVAVIFVIVGTYFVLRASLDWLIKWFMTNKRFYYHPKRFVALSSIKYRISQNATGLANICILSTAALVTIASTTSLYAGIEERYSTKNMFDYELKISSEAKRLEKIINLEQEEIKKKLFQQFNISDFKAYYEMADIFKLTDRGVSIFKDKKNIMNEDFVLITVMELNDFNIRYDTSIKLNDGQLFMQMMGDNRFFENDKIEMINKTYDVKMGDLAVINEAFTVPYIEKSGVVLVSNRDDYFSLVNQFVQKPILNYKMIFNVPEDDNTKRIAINKYFSDILSDAYDYRIENRSHLKAESYHLMGALLFIGVLIGMLFIIATGMVIYYKQISEGYEDTKRYDILNQVGMSVKEIKQTINIQVLVVFFLPVILATLHLLFAFNMIKRILMMMLSIRNLSIYAHISIISTIIFFIAYTLFYKFSSNAYYKIVKPNRLEH